MPVDNRTTAQFLAEDIYLPGWMLIAGEDYSGRQGSFIFTPREFDVARGNIVHYLTPRGLHVCISQAAYCFMEHRVVEQALDVDLDSIRRYLAGSRVKIVELNEKFRREIPLGRPVSATFNLEKLRLGETPFVRIGFNFGNRSMVGSVTSIIARRAVTPLNADITRNLGGNHAS